MEGIMSLIIVLITGVSWVALLLWHRMAIKELEKCYEEDQRKWRAWEYRVSTLELISKKFHPHPEISRPPPPPIGCIKRKGNYEQ